jgi:hypothetical protein
MAIPPAIILDLVQSLSVTMINTSSQIFYKNQLKVSSHAAKPKQPQPSSSFEHIFLANTNICVHSILMSLQIKCLSCSSIPDGMFEIYVWHPTSLYAEVIKSQMDHHHRRPN